MRVRRSADLQSPRNFSSRSPRDRGRLFHRDFGGADEPRGWGGYVARRSNPDRNPWPTRADAETAERAFAVGNGFRSPCRESLPRTDRRDSRASDASRRAWLVASRTGIPGRRLCVFGQLGRGKSSRWRASPSPDPRISFFLFLYPGGIPASSPPRRSRPEAVWHRPPNSGHCARDGLWRPATFQPPLRACIRPIARPVPAHDTRIAGLMRVSDKTLGALGGDLP